MRTGPISCLSVSTPLATINHWWNLGSYGFGGPKTFILSDENVDALAECQPMLHDAMCGGKPAGGSWCKSCAFRLKETRSRRMARIYSDSQYISLTLPDNEYLSRKFNVVQEQLRDYVVAMADVSYVTTALTSVTYVQPASNASKTLIILTCTWNHYFRVTDRCK